MNKLITVAGTVLTVGIAYPLHSSILLLALGFLVAQGWSYGITVIVMALIICTVARFSIPRPVKAMVKARRRWTNSCFSAWKLWLDRRGTKASEARMRITLSDASAERPFMDGGDYAK